MQARPYAIRVDMPNAPREQVEEIKKIFEATEV